MKTTSNTATSKFAFSRPVLWLILVGVSGIPRIVGALFLPNAFGDAYVYIRDIGVFSAKLNDASFGLIDLYGFWLPLYQLISAVVNLAVGNAFYSGKLVSAVFGIGVCVLVYFLTLRLAADQTAAFLGFLLIALNPLHIFNSASALTDVPHAFFVLACLYFVLRDKWMLAGLLGALAGLTRMESWMLLLLIPAIQFIKERRISVPTIVILLIPPVLWLFVSRLATGSAFATFSAREQYHDWLLNANPTLAGFSLPGVIKDTLSLITATDLVVLVAACFAGWRVFRRPGHLFSRKNKEDLSLVAPLIFFFAFLAVLLVAYISRQQPIIFPRYGLILFSLGIPILAQSFLELRRDQREKARRVFTWIVALCVLNAAVQVVGVAGTVNQYSAQRSIADYLRTHFDPNGDKRIFCDDGTVIALSGIPRDKFFSSTDAPQSAEGFLDFIEDKNVQYLVVVPREGSLAAVFSGPDFADSIGNFDFVTNAKTRFLPLDIRVYQRNNVQRKTQGATPLNR